MTPYEDWQTATLVRWVLVWTIVTVVVGGYAYLVYRWVTRPKTQSRRLK